MDDVGEVRGKLFDVPYILYKVSYLEILWSF